MTRLIAIGVGCRGGVAGEAIAALALRALAETGAPEGERRMFTLAAKAGEPGLIEAARLLGVTLTPLALEAAALAGAGQGGRLLSPRLIADGATCAVALSSDQR
jgi:cobalamin biosynthesis protein CbiG